MYHANFKFKTIRNSNDDTKINIFFSNSYLFR